MQRKERTAGITFAATIIFLGSGFTLLMSVATVVGGIYLLRRPPSSAEIGPIPNLNFSLGIALVLYSALSAWGIATGIGVLKLRPWARASVLVFGALMLFTSIFSVLGLALIGPMLPVRAGSPPPAAVWRVLLGVMAIPALVGAWWLVYFNLRSVREQFAEYATTGHYSATDGSAKTLFLGPQRPISITLIALLYLMGVPGLMLAPLRGFPVVLFGVVIYGAAARAIYLIYLPVCIYAGIGLLKLKPPARLLAIGLSVLHLLSGICSVFLPGSEERMEAVLAGMHLALPGVLPLSTLWPLIRIASVVGFLISLVILWALVRAHEAFIPSRTQQTA